MVKAKIKIIFLFFFLLTLTNSFSQEKNLIKNKKNELDKLKNEISSLENQLKLKTSKEKETFDVLDNYNHQSFLLHRLINSLIIEENENETSIDKTKTGIHNLEKEIFSLRENYSKYIVAIYKRGPVNQWASVLDANTFEQAVLRYKYLQKFSAQRVKDIAKLKSKREELISEKSNLEIELKEKQDLADQKQAEEDELNLKKIERQHILNSIKHDKESLKSEIAAKRNAEIKIKNLITKLIEEETRRREEAAALMKLKNSSKMMTGKSLVKEDANANLKSYDLDLSTAGLSSFSALKGRLNWPVERGKIVKGFGENRNERLNTVTLNYGVDIRTRADEDVRSVADGVVSAIDWIPGYGSIIIITHKGDYRTVYSHLSNIFVKEGDRVNMGSIIGKVGESLDGNILHFEIWNSRNKQDPEVWLARK